MTSTSPRLKAYGPRGRRERRSGAAGTTHRELTRSLTGYATNDDAGLYGRVRPTL